MTSNELVEALPPHIQAVVAPVFVALPLDRAMSHLLAGAGSPETHRLLAEAERKLLSYPALMAALWLYADELDRSHQLSQGISTSEGSFWHGIMHRREGDFSNSKYWFHQAGSLPSRLNLSPAALTDEVARTHRENPSHLVEAQRHEWAVLFHHCARQTE
jgi:hypothetical protein